MTITVTKKYRDSILLEVTRSVCPKCKKLLDAQIFERNSRVYMKKRCEEHGVFNSLISSDADMYMRAARFNKPGTMPLKFAKESEKGCPYDCGLCTEHQQHACVGIIEVTQGCNMRCPTCFTDSPSEGFLGLSQIEFMLDKFVEYEGNPEIVQISGGEPTIHPQILEIIGLATKKNFKYVMLNTNGKRIAEDQDFAKELAALKPTIYLQFDGFRESTHLRLRGEDLRESKRQALQHLGKYGLNVVLVMTVQRGVNEDEVGAVVDYAMELHNIKGVVFQPTFYTGRHPEFDPMDRVTLPDVVKAIVAQSSHGFLQNDFVPIPCCYPTCSTATYVYIDENQFTPLPRIVNVEEYLDYFKNRTVVDLSTIVKDGLESLYSAGSVGGSEKLVESYCKACGLEFDLKELQGKVKMIFIQPFMDAYNFELKRVMKCCVNEILPDGRMIPFCAYNTVYR